MSEGRTIAKNTAVVGFFTGVSRILGFVRDIIMASIFGTTLASSAWALAWRLPNLFRAVLGEGALSAAFIPVVSEAQEKGGDEKAEKVASSIFAMVGACLMCIVGVGVFGLLILDSVDLGEKWNSAVSIGSMTLPYVFFICLAALCMGVFHAKGRFLVPAISQSLLNVVWIAVLLFVCPRFGETPMEQIYAVAWGVIGAGVAQLAFQCFFLRLSGFRFRPKVSFSSPEVKRFLQLMGPVFVGSGIMQVNVFVSGLLAMVAGTWAPAAFAFAERLVYAALGPLGTALGTVLLPAFSRQASAAKHDDLMVTLNRSIRVIALIMTPVAAALSSLALPCVKLIYQRGEFDEMSAILVARALAFMAPGLVVFSIYKVVLPAFHGMQNTLTPVRVAACGTGLNLIMNVISVTFLPDGFQHVGLAGSVVLSSLFSTLVLLVLLARKLGGKELVRTGWSVLSTLLSGVIMGYVCLRCHRIALASEWFASSSGSSLYQALAVLLAGAAGMVVYGIARVMVAKDETIAAARVLLARGRPRA